MKKLLVVMLVLTFVLAAATAALAGRGRWDNDPTTPNYIKYSDLAATKKSPTGDPHGGYLTSTNLCSYCHAVHNAGTDGNGGQAWKLTRSPDGGAFGACKYCHVSGNLVTKKPYDTSAFTAPERARHRIDGTATIIPDSTGTDNELDRGTADSLDCLDCHNAAPHAAGETYKLTKDSNYYGNANSGYETPICMRCHNKNFTYGTDGGPTGLSMPWDQKTHPQIDGSAGNERGTRAQPVLNPGSTWYTNRCKNCHSNVGGIGVFPHVSRGPRFLNSAAGDLNTAGTGGQLDAICTSCHQWFDGGPQGVGYSF